jgi:hypothetical protein
MVQLIDYIMNILPIVLLAMIIGFLIYSEFSGTCINWNIFNSIMHRTFFNKGVKVLG